jgi:hypothetical protein
MYRRSLLVAGLLLASACIAWSNPEPAATVPPSLPFTATPQRVPLAQFPPAIDIATVTDIQAGDLDNDGWTDLVVAWYATDNDNAANNRRALSIFVNHKGQLELAQEINLYQQNIQIPALSVLRNGTASVALGDFDGDGDLDMAVTGFFGDELWFIENCGPAGFVPYLRFPFGFNSTSVFLTPPEAAAGDFDGDGRDELVYLADPIQFPDGEILHFWKTLGGVADMYRTDWSVFSGSVYTQWTRGLAVFDFDSDGRPDVCFTGTKNPPNEDGPILTVWYQLDPLTGYFQVRNEYPTYVCADVAPLQTVPSAPPGIVLTDSNGTKAQYWRRLPGALQFEAYGKMAGFTSSSTRRGTAVATGDLNGDGQVDVVTKQKLGYGQSGQIDIQLCRNGGAQWAPVAPNVLDTTGLRTDVSNGILRPRNLVVTDLQGNRLPEIVAGFMATPLSPFEGGGSRLDVMVWLNGPPGDVNRDGRTCALDIGIVSALLGRTVDDPDYLPDADLDRDGAIQLADLSLVLRDFGHNCPSCQGLAPGDMNCDTTVNWADCDGFLLAQRGMADYLNRYPQCAFLNADCTGDVAVNWHDIDPFVAIIQCAVPDRNLDDAHVPDTLPFPDR